MYFMSKQYENLIFQLDKLHRHNRQGSFRTRQRYYETMQRFCRFLADEYHVERLANIAPTHTFAYVIHLQEKGRSASTIKTDLSAIRFFHDLIPSPRYGLPGNAALRIHECFRIDTATAKKWWKKTSSPSKARAGWCGRFR